MLKFDTIYIMGPDHIWARAVTITSGPDMMKEEKKHIRCDEIDNNRLLFYMYNVHIYIMHML